MDVVEKNATDAVLKCGNWHLEREIGRGAYGVVYMASSLCERAAIKEVLCSVKLGESCARAASCQKCNSA